ncbi:InlB B-repeat-containing protein [Alicyclobacillus sp. SO9]|uniref:InlB B-repeat-containing protein n=1 Tax=Alicyclobacillus sp. SO9 TaxID=2665646 RepID=UPI0018E8A6B8|nr:InlB B-repeat-containing protein [Alicyclobacillus sp. SO9]QQE79540.1 InlB B-repeat-containing protein [Alicyclobacillus sp. SO9]
MGKIQATLRFAAALMVASGMVAFLPSTTVLATTSNAPPVANINGTNWVQLSTAAQLEYIDNHQTSDIQTGSSTTYPEAHIELMNTIVLPNGYSWTPLGTSSSNPFDGVFNGNGYEVKNVSVTGPIPDAGFFGVSNGVVKKVGVEGTFSTNDATSNVGGLMGFQNSGTISDSYATGSVSGGANNGGLVGYQNSGTVSDSYATGSVSGAANNGGLVGHQAGGSISDSHATGSVSGSGSDNGGLVGMADGTISDSYAAGFVSGSGSDNGGLVGMADGTISDSYAAGFVSGGTYNGGLVGQLAGGATATISDSYATGSVATGGSTSLNGGLVGYKYSGTISESYFDKDTTGMSTGVGGASSSSGVHAESTTNMQTPSTFSSWNTSDWALLNGYYPLLKWQIGTTMSVTPTVVGAGGKVTVTGSVYSNAGTPLSGINVNLTGNSSGTWALSPVKTGANGDYTGTWTAPKTTQNVIVTATVHGTTVQQHNTVQVQAYTVTYNGNGATGTVPMDGNTYKSGDSVTVAGVGNIINTGNTFAGWNTKANGSGTSYAAGSTMTIGSSNVTLYAQWTANTHSLSYNGNGNTGGSVPSGSDLAYNTTVTIPNNTGNLVRTGYTFVGWNTKANGSGTSYAAGSTLTIGTSNITLYAKWTANKYTVTFNSNGGSSINSEAVAYNGMATKPTDPTKTGYTFAGWYSNSRLTTPSTFSTPVTGNETLYAKWTANKYTVTYKGNSSTGGTMPTDSNTYTIGMNATVLGDGTLAKTGYTFSGWNTKADGTGTRYASGSTLAMNASNVTLYAQWRVAPSISMSSTLPNVLQGTPYDQELQGTGGLSPYTFTIASGSLPNGLTLQSDGSLVGTPQQSGTFHFTVQIKDHAGTTTTKSVSLYVIPTAPRGYLKTVDTKQVVGGSGGTLITKSGDTRATLIVTSGTFANPLQMDITSGTVPGNLIPKDWNLVEAYGVNFDGQYTPSKPMSFALLNQAITPQSKVYKIVNGKLIPVTATVTKGKAAIPFITDPDFVVLQPKPVPHATKPVTGFPAFSWAAGGLFSILTGGLALWWQRRRKNLE